MLCIDIMTHQSTPRNIRQLLKASHFLRHCQTEQRQQSLQSYIKTILPFSNEKLYRCYETAEDIICIEVPNALLRYALLARKNELLTHFQQQNEKLTNIQILVNPKLQNR